MLSKKLPEPGTTKIFRLNSTINKPIVSNILVLPTTEGTHYTS
ncbi:MAG TPA: hypothetical protein PLZ32_12310 [Saprospiraceae bacterium]|nr:hypothetical protein [Saprospiraceae bacterium]